jgi:hypothetical protein
MQKLLERKVPIHDFNINKLSLEASNLIAELTNELAKEFT